MIRLLTPPRCQFALIALGVGLLWVGTCPMLSASPPASNPLAGHYCGPFGDWLIADITISKTGRVTGWLSNFDGANRVDGKVTSTGNLTATVVFGMVRGSQTKIRATATVALDVDGNLTGIWQFVGNAPIPFVWTRCP